MKLHKQTLIIVVFFTFTLPWMVWTNNTGGISRWFDNYIPPGQLWYVMSRLFGLLALTTATWQFYIGLSGKFTNQLFSHRGRHRTVHAVVGTACFTLFWAHALCFTIAVSIRKGHIANNLLLPNLSDFYHSSITLGWVALTLVNIAVLSRLFRSRHQIILHKLVYVIFPFASMHSVLIGSDTRDPVMLLFCFLLITLWLSAIWLAYFDGRRRNAKLQAI